jgi:hypothetical protein
MGMRGCVEVLIFFYFEASAEKLKRLILAIYMRLLIIIKFL